MNNDLQLQTNRRNIMELINNILYIHLFPNKMYLIKIDCNIYKLNKCILYLFMFCS